MERQPMKLYTNKNFETLTKKFYKLYDIAFALTNLRDVHYIFSDFAATDTLYILLDEALCNSTTKFKFEMIHEYLLMKIARTLPKHEKNLLKKSYKIFARTYLD